MKKSKVTTTSALLLIILLSALYIWIVGQNRGDEKNYFHRHLRNYILHSARARAFFNFHGAGDARYEYLRNNQPIELVVSSMAGLESSAEATNRLAESIAQVTGNTVSISFGDTTIPHTYDVTETDLRSMMKGAAVPATAGVVKISVHFLSRNAERPTLIGLTHRDKAIVVYVDTISADVGNDLRSKNDLLVSTALHEFGHQLGLEHNDLPGCLMNSSADINDTLSSNRSMAVTDFCVYEKNLIVQIRTRN